MNIKVIVKNPCEDAKECVIENTLEAMQEIVGGYIETVTTSDFVIICNEEGRWMGLVDNCDICGINFVGTIILAGTDGEEFSDFPMELEILKPLYPMLWEEKE